MLTAVNICSGVVLHKRWDNIKQKAEEIYVSSKSILDHPKWMRGAVLSFMYVAFEEGDD
jgi:hypothetical protein